MGVIFNEDLGNEYLAELRKLGVEVRSIVVNKNGETVFARSLAPFKLDCVHPLYSVTKSFTSIAIGYLVNEGKIDLNAPWIDWFPEYRSHVVDKRMLGVTIRELLTMRLGQDAGISYLGGNDDWALEVVGREMDWDPAGRFHYDSLCSHLLSLLVERVSGRKESEYLRVHLFEPLGIRQWWWEEDAGHHSTGGFGLHLSTPDLAKFGQCLLDGGMLDGKEIIPRMWIDAATTKQVETQPYYPLEATEDNNGYGYQFWMCRGGGYRCAGLFGQLCYVRPEDNLVVAVSSSTTGSKALLDPLYGVLGMSHLCGSKPIESLPVVAGSEHGGRRSESVLSGSHELIDNDYGMQRFELEFKNGDVCFSLIKNGERYAVSASKGVWKENPEKIKPLGDLFQFATHEGEHDTAPDWDSRTLFACCAWVSPTVFELETRELDNTRRCKVRLVVSGLYITLTISAAGMICAPKSAELSAVSRI